MATPSRGGVVVIPFRFSKLSRAKLRHTRSAAMPPSPKHCRIALLAVLVLASACRVGTAPTPRAGALRCRPERLGPADTLTLAMAVPHGRELSIQNPAGDFFMLVLNHPRVADGPMLMTAEAFRTMPEVRLPAAALRAKPFVFGRDSTELVFSSPGVYRIQVAEALNTDDGTPVSACTVQLRSP